MPDLYSVGGQLNLCRWGSASLDSAESAKARFTFCGEGLTGCIVTV